jgi:hypothetical protein
MKRPARFLFSVGLATMVVVAASSNGSAAEGDASTQVLLQLDIPDQVTTAHWTRLPDAYVLKLVIDRPATPARSESAAVARPTDSNDTRSSAPDRPSFFLGSNTFVGSNIANLRGMDPVLGCRTLTLVDGRRVVSTAQQPGAAPPPPTPPAGPSPMTMNQPYPPKYKDHRVDVWLLKEDGTQILPATYSCDLTRRGPDKSRPHAEISYEFPLASAAQAVAAAIRIEDRYFIEKLQLTAEPVVRQ